MAPKKGGPREESPANRRQDPYVERLRPDPGKPAEPALTMAGLLGDSDRPGYRRLYFTRALDHFAEVRVEDILSVEAIPPEHPPFVGLDATRFTIKRDAPVMYLHKYPGSPIDPWDLDVKLQGVASFYRPWKYVRTGYIGCLERLSLGEDCPTQKDTTCLTCHGPACDRITRGFSCDYQFCPRGDDFATAAGGTCITCGGAECPDTLVSCKPC